MGDKKKPRCPLPGMVYPYPMDKHDATTKRLLKETERSYWLGVAVGVVVGIIIGILIGLDFGSTTTLVIPLSEGVKV